MSETVLRYGIEILKVLNLFMYKSTPTDYSRATLESGRRRSTTETGGNGVQDDGENRKWIGNGTS
jgi:hypothetical protein